MSKFDVTEELKVGLDRAAKSALDDMKGGFFTDVTVLVTKLPGLQIQLKVTRDEGDFID